MLTATQEAADGSMMATGHQNLSSPGHVPLFVYLILYKLLESNKIIENKIYPDIPRSLNLNVLKPLMSLQVSPEYLMAVPVKLLGFWLSNSGHPGTAVCFILSEW